MNIHTIAVCFCLYCVTTMLSTHYNTHCFALQNRLFYVAKQALLHRKTASFRKPKYLSCFVMAFGLYKNTECPSWADLPI